MAVPTNTVQTFDRNSIREDLSDIISNIAPTETPFVSNIGSGTATQRTHEWQTEDLAAADGGNAHIEGDDTDADVASPTVRLNNKTQIFKKAVAVSGTARAVDNAGYADELVRQVERKGKEIKRDIEKRACSNSPAVAGNSSTASEMAGAVAFMRTNASRGAGGAAPTVAGGMVNAGATDGTLRDFDESQLKDVVQQAWTNGGTPTMALMSGELKQTASAFAGIAAQRKENNGGGQATIIGAADVYVSDFGDIMFVPSRYTTGRDVIVIDPTLWKMAELRPYKLEELAKTGDSDKRQILCEKTLVCMNDAGNGVVADVQAA